MITMKHLLTFFLFVCFAVTAAGQSVSELLRKAEAGDAEAQFNLGVCYYKGQGVGQDYVQIVYWWRKAAEQGDVEAQFKLGLLYVKGEGVEMDIIQAMFWLEKAAGQGHKAAETTLYTIKDWIIDNFGE